MQREESRPPTPSSLLHPSPWQQPREFSSASSSLPWLSLSSLVPLCALRAFGLDRAVLSPCSESSLPPRMPSSSSHPVSFFRKCPCTPDSVPFHKPMEGPWGWDGVCGQPPCGMRACPPRLHTSAPTGRGYALLTSGSPRAEKVLPVCWINERKSQ